MNKLLALFALVANLSFSQTIIQYDYMETSSTTYLSAGWWIPAATTGWFNNASVTPTLSAVIYGSGNGTSANEQDWYSLPNVTGLNNTHQYQLKFRLGSYSFASPSAATRGVDGGDFVDVQVSTNGGVNYISELRITGNANAQWPFTSTGTVTHTANGTYTNSAAPVGDVYQAPAGITTTGPSTITLNLPAGLSQVAIDFFCRVNSAGEEWWIDNVELWDMTPVGLPVELTYFTGQCVDGVNMLTWQTASEHNSDYFLVMRSTTGEFNEGSTITLQESTGNSTEIVNYAYADKVYDAAMNYYQLIQVDNDGVRKQYGPILIDNTRKQKTVVKTINMMGQECVPSLVRGVYFEIYDDGTSKKVMQ